MVKPVSIKDEKEKNIIEYLESNGHLKNFSYYVKNLIVEDMKKAENKTNKGEEIPKKNKRISNFDI